MANKLECIDGLLYGSIDTEWTVSSFEDCDDKEKLAIDRIIVFNGFELDDLASGFVAHAKVRMNTQLKKLTRDEIIALRNTKINASDVGIAIVSQEKKDKEAVTVMNRASMDAKLTFIEELKKEGLI